MHIGGSGTSEVMCQAAMNACATLNARLDPYRPQSSTNHLTGSYEDDRVANWLALLKKVPGEVRSIITVSLS